jgi:hypothetical protein
MTGQLSVALETRKPRAAAFEFDGDNIRPGRVMRAPSLVIDPDAVYFDAFDSALHT